MLNVRSVQGKLNLTTCRGTGGQAAANGAGGQGKVFKVSSVYRGRIMSKKQTTNKTRLIVDLYNFLFSRGRLALAITI